MPSIIQKCWTPKMVCLPAPWGNESSGCTDKRAGAPYENMTFSRSQSHGRIKIPPLHGMPDVSCAAAPVPVECKRESQVTRTSRPAPQLPWCSGHPCSCALDFEWTPMLGSYCSGRFLWLRFYFSRTAISFHDTLVIAKWLGTPVSPLPVKCILGQITGLGRFLLVDWLISLF